MEIFEEDDFLTYCLATDYGDFRYWQSSENNLLHLYRKIDTVNNPIIENRINFAIIKLQRFNGFKKMGIKEQWKNRKYYKKPFAYVFEKEEASVVTAFLLELDNVENIRRKESIDNWRLVYEREKNKTFSEAKFGWFKTKYYEYKLPILVRI